MALGLTAAFLRRVQGDLRQLLPGGAELVEVALGHHPDPVGGGRGAEGQRPLQEAVGPEATPAPAAGGDRGPPLVPLGGRLPDRAEAHDVLAQAEGHGGDGVHDRPELARRLDPALPPVQVEPERLLELDHADTGEARRHAHVPGVGGDAVDVVDRQAGVLEGCEGGVDRQVEGISVDPAADLALPDPADDRLRLRSARHDPSVSDLKAGPRRPTGTSWQRPQPRLARSAGRSGPRSSRFGSRGPCSASSRRGAP